MNVHTAWVASVVLLSGWALSHGGGLDQNGGHTNKKTGEYHCHSDACFATQQKSQDALEEAIDEGRSFSYVYDRKTWAHWSDFDNDCVNTRHELLSAQSIIPATFSKNGCYVATGEWVDPYSGQRFTQASDLDIDHVVPLHWAHTHGGHNWTKEVKEQFANDPTNLLIVDDGLNQDKKAMGPVRWMPPRKSFHCDYLTRWWTVLSKYELELHQAEQASFDEKYKGCD